MIAIIVQVWASKCFLGTWTFRARDYGDISRPSNYHLFRPKSAPYKATGRVPLHISVLFTSNDAQAGFAKARNPKQCTLRLLSALRVKAVCMFQLALEQDTLMGLNKNAELATSLEV